MECRTKGNRPGKLKLGKFKPGEFRPGMSTYALAFLLGVVFVQQLAELPTSNQLLGLLIGLSVSILLVYFLRRRYPQTECKQCALIISCIILIIIGFMYASFTANQQLTSRIDESLVGKNLLLTGTVVGIPVTERNVQRFDLNVEQLVMLDDGSNTESTDNIVQQSGTSQTLPKKVRLSWYNRNNSIDVGAAEKWQFEVRLKPPHGFRNPGGFDYEGWLFQHGIQATGYIRQSELNQRQSPNQNKNQQPNESLFSDVTRLRQNIGARIDAIAAQTTGEKSKTFALIKALAIGDKSTISKQQWQVLSATGTSHLMAISGLHIGLAALFAYIIIRRLVPVPVMKVMPAQHVALIASVPAALMYALIAGFSVPTQRAFIMLFVLSMMMLIRRNHRPVDALGFALFIILLLDPLAVLSAGFWFSFSAVAVIFISLSSYRIESIEALKQDSSTKNVLWSKFIYILKKWIRLQILISLFLLPLSLFMFQQVSLVSPLANLLLIPYVSFLVVPLVLLSLCVSFISPGLADQLFSYAAGLLDFIWPAITYLSELPYALWFQGDVGIVKLLLATAALFLMYFSKQVASAVAARKGQDPSATRLSQYISFVAVVLFAAVFYVGGSTLQEGDFKVTVLDVGQGSAAVVQTKNHVAVFDTGAKFSEKLDIGSSVIIPYLRSQQVRFIDRLIISHGDADHIGGSAALLKTYPETSVLGQDIAELQAANKQDCFAGFSWQWDGVNFEILSPSEPQKQVAAQKTPYKNTPAKKAAKTGKRNNHSCVLKISSVAGSIIFTGDIERVIEQALVSNSRKQLKSDVLIIPHHGSKTSSSQEFIDAVGAKISVMSVGYKNRYRLPNKQVLSRYEDSAGTVLRTDKNGAITIMFERNEGIQFEQYRQKSKKYWHHRMD